MLIKSFYIHLQDIVLASQKTITRLVDSPRALGVLCLSSSLSMTVVSAWAVGSNSLSWAAEENRTLLAKTKEAIKTKLQVEEAHLAGLEGLYDASNEVEADEFASFLNAIFEGSNGPKGRECIGFIQNELNDQQLINTASGKE